MENVDLESENRSALHFDSIAGASGAGRDVLDSRSVSRRRTISKNLPPHSRRVCGKQQPRHTKKEGTTMNRMSEIARADAIPHLEIGSQLFHNGVPVQLLYRVGREKQHETWRVRPLFVEAPDRNERFSRSDSFSLLHTMRAPRWSWAA